MLNHFEAKAEKAKKNELPKWVSENNLSKPAYFAIVKKQAELMAYIERHKNLNDFKAKKLTTFRREVSRQH